MNRYRVECNFGCRYFKDIRKAKQYFDKCVTKHLNVELWLVTYIHCPVAGKYAAVQELLAYSGTGFPKR